MTLRVAFLADIHGNLPALEAVLEDLRVVAPDAVYLVGDQINRCPWNNEVMAIIEAQGWPAIQGNHELIVAALEAVDMPAVFTDRARFPDLWWTYETLAVPHLQTVRQLPEERRIVFDECPAIRMLHGVPGNSFVGVLPETADEDICEDLAAVEEGIVVCGHTHRPLWRRAGRWEVFNGGSVGMPYNGDPRSQYLVLEAADGRWRPQFRKVDYARERVREGFVTHGLLAAYGPLAVLHLATVETGQPWVSDFGHWVKSQPPSIQKDMEHAVVLYMSEHGPGRWSFLRPRRQAIP